MDNILEVIRDLRKRIEILEGGTALQSITLPTGGKLVLPKISSAPGSPVQGQSYFDTTTNKARTWDGSAWQNWW